MGNETTPAPPPETVRDAQTVIKPGPKMAERLSVIKLRQAGLVPRVLDLVGRMDLSQVEVDSAQTPFGSRQWRNEFVSVLIVYSR